MGIQKHNYGALTIQMTKLLQDENVVRSRDRWIVRNYLVELLETENELCSSV
jgi:hypothetical protein